jgi:hypothetical protein
MAQNNAPEAGSMIGAVSSPASAGDNHKPDGREDPMSSRAQYHSAARGQHALPSAEDPRCLARLLRSVRFAWLAALLFAGCTAADGTARGAFTVWAIGLPNGYIVMEHQAQVVHVTAEDAARGMVEVRGGSRLIVTTHAPSRYALDFTNQSTVFRPIGINGVAEVRLRPKGASVSQQQPAGRRVVALDYKFALAPGTRPGVYPWPLTLSGRGVSHEGVPELGGDHHDVLLSGQTR